MTKTMFSHREHDDDDDADDHGHILRYAVSKHVSPLISPV